jgi:hypothetical protein
MRLCVALALVSILASSVAVAAPGKGKGKGKKAKEKEVPAGPNMDSNDPVYKEESDEGRYAPKGVTGELKAKEEAQAKAKVRPKKYVPPPRDPFVVFGDIVLGFGKSPKPGPDVAGETTDATLLALSVGAAYDLFPRFTAGVRVPWTTASMELESGVDSEQEMAFGSPIVFTEYRAPLSRVTTLPILFAIGIPIAQGDPDPNAADEVARRRGTVNLLADAAQGWRDSELYGVKRLPIVFGLGVRHVAEGFEFHAYDKLVVGIDTGTKLLPATYPEGNLVIEKASLRNVTLVGFTYDLIDKPVLWAGLEAWLAYTPIQPIDFESSATDPTPLQFVAEPRAGARFGKFRPSLGLVFPIGGRLADSGISGVRVHVDYAF